jgi:hypothetical protein
LRDEPGRFDMHRLIVIDGSDYYTYVGELIEWGTDAVTLKLSSSDGSTKLVKVALASLVGSEEIAA